MTQITDKHIITESAKFSEGEAHDMNTQESETVFGRSEEATIFVRYSAVPRDMLLS